MMLTLNLTAAAAVTGNFPQNLHVLNDTQMGALVALVSVAVGISVAYLALDKLRHRNELEIHVVKLRGALDPADVLIKRIYNLTIVERTYLGFEYYCVNDDCHSEIQKKKAEIFDGSMDTMLNFLLFWIAYVQIDRWLIKTITTLLCLILFYITYVITHGNSPTRFLNTNLFEQLLWIVVLSSYIVPTFFSPAGALMVWLCKRTVKNHLRDARASGTSSASAAQIPGLST